MKDAPSLYVHVPFCETKCPYCDFNSFAVAGRDVASYFDALRREMDARGVPASPPTVFVGGGTPTVVEPDVLDRYLGDLVARLTPDPGREFTVEANPGSLTREKVAVLRAHGVNRVSLGAQSFFDRHLRTLGRVHAASQIEEAAGFMRDEGIADLNLDLIHSVPGLDREEWLATLDRALALGPDHVAAYALIFEPGTEFHARRRRGSLCPVPEDEELRQYLWTARRLERAGYVRYEISNFARPGHECRHNLRYWRNESYAGFGAGAVSYLGGERCANERGLDRYAESVRATGRAVVSTERLDPPARAAETVALGLRTTAGVDLAEVAERTGWDAVSAFRPIASRLVARGWLRPGPRLTLTRMGWRFADTVAATFL